MLLFDVVIVGSGPAGASAAFFLADKGLKVAILEKETLPRYKTCGGGLVFRGRDLLPFDVSEAIASEFNTIDVYFEKEEMHLQAKRDFPIVSMVMRDTFDAMIIEKAVEKGVLLLQNEKLLAIEESGNNKVLKTSSQELEARFVIAADGALSTTAKLTGWKIDTRYLIPALEVEVEVKPEKFEQLKQETRFDVDFIPKGYAWSFPKKNHLSLGVASVKRGKIDLRSYYREYLKKLGIDETDIVSEQSHGFQIPISTRKGKLAQNGTFLVGDAAGFADPLTAEGISNAIYSGKLAAEAIIETDATFGKAEALYTKKINEKLLPELKTAKYLASVFYNQRRMRNYFIKKDGDRFCNFLTDIFTGKRHYPADVIQLVKDKLKGLVFAK